jgi:Spy/CpxP family protein refolding chaperone
VLPLAAAQAAMSSLPTEMAAMSTLIADQTSGEKLEALHREEELVEEERIVLDSAVDKLEDRMFAPDTTPETTVSSSAPSKLGTAALSAYEEGDAFEKAADAAQIPLEAADRELEAADLDLPAAQYMANAEALSAAGAKGPGAVPGAVAEAEPVVHLTREQIANLAEAIDTMIDSPIRMEREEMAELEAERVAAAGTVEEAKKSSRAVKLLDSRVQSMMDRIKTEMEASEVSIGAAFHKLDLDGDGMLSKGELLKAMEELEPSRRPDAQAFEALLVKMDTDQDGQISVGEIRKLIKDMREIADVTDEENTGVTPGAKAAAAAAAAGGSGP